jgi:thiol:disulfide interchange protein DsbA
MPRLLRAALLFTLILPAACSADQAPQAGAPAPSAGTGAAAPIQLAQAGTAAPATSGYTVLRVPQDVSTPGKIEVVEVFLYTCPHCYAFEPTVTAWRKKLPADVAFVRVPASFGPTGELLAKTYYTEEALGVLDKMHPVIFDAIHKLRRPLNTEDDMAKLFAENGIKESDFRGTFESFMIDSKVRRAQQLEVAYGVTGVPAMAVNGKYGVAITSSGPEGMLKTVDQLIASERKAASGKS